MHLIALDNKYFDRFSKYMFLGLNQDLFTLHIHLINPTQDQIDILEKENVNYSYEYENYLDNKPYLISSRFLILNELMSCYRNAEVF